MINGFQLLAGIIQLLGLVGMLVGAYSREKYRFASSLGLSVAMLGVSINAVKGVTMMSFTYLGGYLLAGGLFALAALALIAARKRTQTRASKKFSRPQPSPEEARRIA